MVGDVDFPYHVDGRGRTATTDRDDHLRDLIEQVLFTAPGERVMRPDFGSGLLALVFEPNGPTLGATTQILVQGALQQQLGAPDRGAGGRGRAATTRALRVDVRYVVLHDRTTQTASFTAPGSGA